MTMIMPDAMDVIVALAVVFAVAFLLAWMASPRLRVEQGSVGLTGRQTGIYTEVRPGGWNIIGRTPLQLVDVQAEYFPLRTGDRVQFTRIDEREFAVLVGTRLACV